MKKIPAKLFERMDALASELEDLRAEGDDWMADRSDKWQEEKGGDYEAWLDEISDTADKLRDLPETPDLG